MVQYLRNGYTIAQFVFGGSYRFVHNTIWLSAACVLKKNKKPKYKN